MNLLNLELKLTRIPAASEKKRPSILHTGDNDRYIGLLRFERNTTNEVTWGLFWHYQSIQRGLFTPYAYFQGVQLCIYCSSWIFFMNKRPNLPKYAHYDVNIKWCGPHSMIERANVDKGRAQKVSMGRKGPNKHRTWYRITYSTNVNIRTIMLSMHVYCRT